MAIFGWHARCPCHHNYYCGLSPSALEKSRKKVSPRGCTYCRRLRQRQRDEYLHRSLNRDLDVLFQWAMAPHTHTYAQIYINICSVTNYGIHELRMTRGYIKNMLTQSRFSYGFIGFFKYVVAPRTHAPTYVHS